MAHTPLFSALQRTLAKARWAQHHGLTTPAQRQAAWEQWSMDRRQFLQRSLGTAALASIPLIGGGCYGDTDRTESAVIVEAGDDADRTESVVIVGAGIAGLHCAFRLQQAGIRARVFDAGNRVGGRMLSSRRLFAEGQVVELGGEFVDTTHVCMRALAAEFGLQVDDTLANLPPDFIIDTYFFEGRSVLEDEIVALFAPLADAMARDFEASEASDDVFEEIDAMSITEWLVANNADPLIQSIFEIAYIAEFGLEADAQTVFNLLCQIDFETLDPFRIFGDSDERFRIHAGNDTITTMLAERLESQIELETRLVAVTELADGRFQLTFVRSAGATFDITADHMVFALPFTLLRQVDLNVTLPDDKQRVIRELGYGTNTKLLGGTTSRIWREQFNASGSSFTDNGIQILFDGSDRQPGTSGVLTNFTGGNAGVDVGNGSAGDQMLAVLPLADEIFPGLEAAFIPNSAVRMHWPTAPLVQGSYTCYRPGQTSFFGVEGRREGNLHFCGEHTSQDFQGFMEGGAETGGVVATEILDDLGMALPAALRQMLQPTAAIPQGSVRGARRRRLVGVPRRGIIRR